MVTGIPSAWLPQANASAEELASAPFWIRDARFSQLQSRTNDHQNKQATATASLSDILDDPGLSNEEARDALSAALKSKLAVMFVVGKEDIDETMTLAQLGVDSLLAVELRNWLSAASRAECSVFDVMQSSSIVDLAERIVAKAALRADQKG
jgi:acyl carrier protein